MAAEAISRPRVLPENWLLAAIFAAPVVAALVLLPFLAFRPNRLVTGDGIWLWDLSSPAGSLIGVGVLSGLALASILTDRQLLRAFSAAVGAAATAWLAGAGASRSEEHTSELQSRGHLVCR